MYTKRVIEITIIFFFFAYVNKKKKIKKKISFTSNNTINMILLSFLHEYIRKYDDTFHFFGRDSNDNGTCYNFPPDDTTWILLIIDITFYNDTNKTYLITSLTLKLMSFLFF